MRYPEIIHHPADSATPSSFVEGVDSVVGELIQSRFGCLPSWQRKYFELQRSRGFERGVAEFLRLVKTGKIRVPESEVPGLKNPTGSVKAELGLRFFHFVHQLPFFLGRFIIDRLGGRVSDWSPFAYPEIAPGGPDGRQIHIGWCAMPRSEPKCFVTRQYPDVAMRADPIVSGPPTASGPVEIEHQGSRFRLAYSDHAVLEQLGPRVFPFMRQYGHLQSAFQFLNGMTSRFRVASLPAGNVAIAAYKIAPVGSWEMGVCERMVGADAVLRGARTELEGLTSYAFLLVGYAPIAFVDSLAIAKTILPPWYRATPLAEYLATADGVPSEMKSLLGKMQEESAVTRLFSSTAEIDLLSFLHRRGLPIILDRAGDVLR